MTKAIATASAAEEIKKLLDDDNLRDSIARLIAVAIRADEIHCSGADPEDCIWDDEDLNPLYKSLGDDFDQIDSEARSINAAKRLCRALQKEESEQGEDDVTTLQCSAIEGYLHRMLDIFGWGFPYPKD